MHDGLSKRETAQAGAVLRVKMQAIAVAALDLHRDLYNSRELSWLITLTVKIRPSASSFALTLPESHCSLGSMARSWMWGLGKVGERPDIGLAVQDAPMQGRCHPSVSSPQRYLFGKLDGCRYLREPCNGSSRDQRKAGIVPLPQTWKGCP